MVLEPLECYSSFKDEQLVSILHENGFESPESIRIQQTTWKETFLIVWQQSSKGEGFARFQKRSDDKTAYKQKNESQNQCVSLFRPYQFVGYLFHRPVPHPLSCNSNAPEITLS